MAGKTRQNKKSSPKANKATRENSVYDNNNMMSGIFDPSFGYGTLSPSSYPFQLSTASQYNPLSLNRILLNYSYMTFGVIQTLIDQPVLDAIRGGVDIECDELDEDDIALLQDVLIELKDYDAVATTLRWARLFGGAGMIINTAQDPTTELDMDAINDETPLGFIDADRWELTLNYYLEENIPCPYNYYNQPLHKSRVVKVNGKEAPSFIRRRLQGWGMSELERTIRNVNAYSKNEDVIYALLEEAKQDVWMIENLNSKLATSNGQASIAARVELANRMKNYSNAIVMDSNDKYDQKQLSFGGLGEMQNQNRIGLAAAIRMPISKLFGIGSTGFSSGEDDLENYNSMVESEIRSKMREPLHMVVKLRCKQLFGFIPEHFEIHFKPLRILSEEGMENIKDKKYNRACGLMNMGFFTPKEFGEQLIKDNIISMETEVGRGLRDLEPPLPPTNTPMPKDLVSAPAKEKGENQ